MGKKQWIFVLGGVMVLLLVVWGITYFTKTEDTLGKAVDEAKEETEENRKELSEAMSDLAGIKENLVSMEEIESQLRIWEEDGELGNGTPDEIYKKIQEKYGKETAKAYERGGLYKESDSDFIKDQIILGYRMEAEKGNAVSVLPLMSIHRPIGLQKYYMDEVLEPYMILDKDEYDEDIHDSQFYLDTNGFSQVGDYLIGYPQIVTNLFDMAELQRHLPEINWENVDESLNKVIVPLKFYVLLEDDLSLEDAIDKLSNMDVTVNGIKARYYGKYLEDFSTELPKNDKKSLLMLDIQKGMNYLPKDGVVPVYYELDLLSILPKDGNELRKLGGNKVNELLIETLKGYETMELLIDGKEFTLNRGNQLEGNLYFDNQVHR